MHERGATVRVNGCNLQGATTRTRKTWQLPVAPAGGAEYSVDQLTLTSYRAAAPSLVASHTEKVVLDADGAGSFRLARTHHISTPTTVDLQALTEVRGDTFQLLCPTAGMTVTVHQRDDPEATTVTSGTQ